jgi:hypothetical protein
MICCNFTAQGQFFKKKKEKNRGEQVKLDSDTLSIEITDIVFKNINRVSFYTNPKLLREIEELDQQKDWKALYPRLQEYVSNFGVQNFAYQTYYLWRLAKLTEIFGSVDQARPLYSMAYPLSKYYLATTQLTLIEFKTLFLSSTIMI